MKPAAKLILILLFFSTLSFAQTADKILVGPAYKLAAKEIISDKPDGLYNILNSSKINPETLYPSREESLRKKEYAELSANDNVISFRMEENTIVYTVLFIENENFSNGELKIKSNVPLSAYLNSDEIFDSGIIKKGIEDGEYKKSISLEAGKHYLFTKIYSPKTRDVTLEYSYTSTNDEDVKFSVDPTRYTTVSDLLDNRKISSVSISGDGAYTLVKVTERDKELNKSISSLEIYYTFDGRLKEVIKPADDFGNLDWSPASQRIAYVVSNSGKSTLYLRDFENNTTSTLMENVENFAGYNWSDDGLKIIYTTSKSDSKKEDLKRYEYPQSRYPWYGGKSSIYMYDLFSGVSQELVSGDDSYSFLDMSSDNKQILYSTSSINFDERPYGKSHYYLYDMVSGGTDSLFTLNWGGGAEFSPDGKSILVSGGPSEFGGTGKNTDADIPNDYDTQAYIYNIASKEVKAITKNFNPSLNSMYWDAKTGKIFFNVTDESYRNLYQFDPKSEKFEKIDTGVEYVASISYSPNSNMSVFKGSSSNVIDKVYILDRYRKSAKLLVDVDAENYDHIRLGDVKDFDFESETGYNVKGRVYYPVNFDKSKKYPAIVYYYGGTSPVTREFEGRYPKNIWTANGYFVYVLQPTGAYGFGQNYSSVHVNDWGEVTAKQIIEGTEKFLDAHQFVDGDNLGCIGASYGGFMTMNVITKTDMFAAAISHAGISALTSYWGEGYWGFLYSSVATAESFPWNRRDIYVDHSPIYNADKINTPLLLLHGSSDTNVPRGESLQMYAALKLLKKDVEYVEVDGLDHHIMQYDKRKKWTKTIVAYFDKYLKNKPDWWKSLYEE
ncbi:MAG: peptidase S9 [Melioribacteraceae bacterium]|nr:MAG: peptidase S9 [Melioribacteraceae bacterium]